MVQWEYRSLSVRTWEQLMNVMGADGWELVGFSGERAYLKRPVEVEAEVEEGPVVEERVGDGVFSRFYLRWGVGILVCSDCGVVQSWYTDSPVGLEAVLDAARTHVAFVDHDEEGTDV